MARPQAPLPSRNHVRKPGTPHPVEAALPPGREGGWRAARPVGQRLRLLFDEPQVIRRVYLVFDEHERARTQELTLLWSPPGGSALQEIVRQQYNFSPPVTTREVENYAVNLGRVLELRLMPHVAGMRRSRR